MVSDYFHYFNRFISIVPSKYHIILDTIYHEVLKMYEENFSNRLTQLRTQKGVSARDMSLSIGQNPGYINNIETGKAFPSMTNFFYICEYLDITPMDFFNFDSSHPKELDMLYNDLNKLTDSQFRIIYALVDELVKK